MLRPRWSSAAVTGQSLRSLIRQTAPRIPPLFSSGGATSTSPTALITPALIRISCSSDSTKATAEDETIGPPPAPQPATGECCGLRVVSMDGSTTDVPDSEKNHAFFGWP